MGREITRRDFLNGVAVAVGGALAGEACSAEALLASILKAPAAIDGRHREHTTPPRAMMKNTGSRSVSVAAAHTRHRPNSNP